MSNPYFRFRQFTVFHDQCAMKVGTDGVLLGAWVGCANTQTILDIGTGTGLIALMLAQRSPAARIDAIDIEEGAYKQAKLNFESSLWADRLSAYHISLQDFNPSHKYDLIACNPPYFVHSLKSPDKSRTHARHNDSLSFGDLIKRSKELLSPSGKLALILPFTVRDEIDAIAKNNQLHLNKATLVYSTPGSLPKRVLLEYSFFEGNVQQSELIIEQARHLYTDDYKYLTKDFYLK